MRLRKEAGERFGIEQQFREGQEQLSSAVLQERSAVGVLPTSAGK